MNKNQNIQRNKNFKSFNEKMKLSAKKIVNLSLNFH